MTRGGIYVAGFFKYNENGEMNDAIVIEDCAVANMMQIFYV